MMPWAGTQHPRRRLTCGDNPAPTTIGAVLEALD
jgi:hypothetical protein